MNLARAGYPRMALYGRRMCVTSKSMSSVVVFVFSEGDGKTNLPYRNSGTISDSQERLGWLKLIVWHLEIVECLDR